MHRDSIAELLKTGKALDEVPLLSQAPNLSQILFPTSPSNKPLPVPPGDTPLRPAGLMGCIQNDAYLNGLNNYKQWRDQHPNASNEEIRNYINGQMGQAFNPMATLSDSMNAGTLNMKDTDRQKYNDNKDVMLSAMMEFSYTNMNKQYGNKW